MSSITGLWALMIVTHRPRAFATLGDHESGWAILDCVLAKHL